MPVFRITTAAGGTRVTGRITAALAGVAALLSVTGCDLAVEHQLDFSNTEEVRITRITISPGAGDVAVRTGAVSGVEIARTVRYRGGAEPDTAYRIDGTELFIDTDCGHDCSVSFDILAPEGVAVRGENGSGDAVFARTGAVDYTVGSGDIELIDPVGTVRAETGSGDITITGATAPLTLRTRSGSISGRGLGGGEVRAETGSGDVELALDEPASVRADTGSGNVRLTVPAGRYQVKVDTGSGESDVRVPHDPNATLTIAVHTGSGDITVDGAL